jgi:hypothetical protein
MGLIISLLTGSRYRFNEIKAGTSTENVNVGCCYVLLSPYICPIFRLIHESHVYDSFYENWPCYSTQSQKVTKWAESAISIILRENSELNMVHCPGNDINNDGTINKINESEISGL